MRFFWTVCLIGIIVSCMGCMARNWASTRDQPGDQREQETEKEFSVFSNGTMERELFGSGVDSQSKDIEKRLGFKQK